MATQSFTTAGTFSWTCPPDTWYVTAQCIGGGGSGGGTGGINCTGSGGCGGNFAQSTVAVQPGRVYSVVVAATKSTASGTSTSATNTGNSSSFSDPVPTTLVLATGGLGGNPGPAGTNGAAVTASTTGCVGTTIFAGGNSGAGTSAGTGGGGGGGAGSGGAGGNASGGTAGTGTATGGGNGSNGAVNSTGATVGATPSNAGGGQGGNHGGSSGTSAGNSLQPGSRGRVDLTWTPNPKPIQMSQSINRAASY